MKNLELQSLGLRELDAKEMVEMEGGICFFKFVLRGVLDGVKHNTECHLTLFGWNVF